MSSHFKVTFNIFRRRRKRARTFLSTQSIDLPCFNQIFLLLSVLFCCFRKINLINELFYIKCKLCRSDIMTFLTFAKPPGLIFKNQNKKKEFLFTDPILQLYLTQGDHIYNFLYLQKKINDRKSQYTYYAWHIFKIIAKK